MILRKISAEIHDRRRCKIVLHSVPCHRRTPLSISNDEQSETESLKHWNLQRMQQSTEFHESSGKISVGATAADVGWSASTFSLRACSCRLRAASLAISSNVPPSSLLTCKRGTWPMKKQQKRFWSYTVGAQCQVSFAEWKMCYSFVLQSIIDGECSCAWLQSLIEEMDDIYDENNRLRQCLIDESRSAPLRNRLRRDNGELQQQLRDKEQELTDVTKNLEAVEEELIVTRSKLRFIFRLFFTELIYICVYYKWWPVYTERTRETDASSLSTDRICLW